MLVIQRSRIPYFLSSGVASEWTELLSHCIRCSRQARNYLASEVLFKHPNRFQEYLIDCPTADVSASFRRTFSMTILFASRFVVHSVEF